MNILVTGGLGLIGSNLVEKLRLENHNVITLDLKPEADYVLDISKDDLSQIKEDINVIYHLAAQPFGRGSEEDPFKDLDFNTKGTLNVCYLAKLKNVSQVIYTSTMAVYGDKHLASPRGSTVLRSENHKSIRYNNELDTAGIHGDTLEQHAKGMALCKDM